MELPPIHCSKLDRLPRLLQLLQLHVKMNSLWALFPSPSFPCVLVVHLPNFDMYREHEQTELFLFSFDIWEIRTNPRKE